MSTDKYPSIFLLQMEGIVYIMEILLAISGRLYVADNELYSLLVLTIL